MTATISKWGNSQGVRLPKDLMEDLHIAIGDKVDIQIKDEMAIIKPIKKKKYNLDDLVKQIPKNYKPTEEIDSKMGLEEW
ncbi:MAG: AbrB/MazE/SpoVT family DNA-binding domain-containing protein [Campylobacterales bacterium]|nr:AbrB/MazE/SpoVT family DNA-binding domain-containing protein [Campylobacterales bacterium]